mmetsp:Transcript_9697/g.17030  ORF Transcript_9697/g.17030 Transcript_9697/m.17030 type:complete len:281 (-) Transcript_9697:94-936(-)
MSSSSSGSSSSADSGSASGEEEAEAKKSKKTEEVAVSDAESDSSSDSDSSSSESSDKKKKKKKKAKKDSKKKKKKEKKDKKKKKGKKKDKKKGKKGKQGKAGLKKTKRKRANRDAVSNQFGKYGVLKQEDFFNKKPEFLAWASEVKKADTDQMGQMQLKDLFKEYVEDYNTATMPTKKYYNLQVWDSHQAMKRNKKNRGDEMTEAQRASLTSFDDEQARREEIKHIQARKQEQQIADEVKKMRTNKSKVEDMRKQDILRTQRDMLNKAGHTEEAKKIMNK